MLFVDQFEELYTQVSDPEERAAFTACLSAVADDATSPLRVVLSVRADFLDRVAEDPQFLGELMQGLFFLGPPSRDGLRDAITQPAEMAGFRFELEATIEDMLDHLETTPGALPLLQFAASKLWETRDRARRMLTHASYSSMGGVAGALSSHAERVVESLGPAKLGLVRTVLLRLVTPERTRAIVPMAELRELSREVGEVQRLVDQMVDARLLVVQTPTSGPSDGGKGSTVEIVHESLLLGWPSLRRWLDENQDDAALVDQLRTAARQWHAKGRDAGVLWRGDTADEARKFRKRYKGPLSDVERAFLDECVHEMQAQVRRRRVGVIAGFVLLSAIVLAAMVALVIIQRSRAEAKDQQEQAEVAKKEAERQLAVARAKELERQKFEAAKNKAEEVTKTTEDKLVVADATLVEKNRELTEALNVALEAEKKEKLERKRAEDSAERAEKSQKEAVASKEAAEKARAETAKLLKKEKDRADRLQQQLGSPAIDDLK